MSRILRRLLAWELLIVICLSGAVVAAMLYRAHRRQAAAATCAGEDRHPETRPASPAVATGELRVETTEQSPPDLEAILRAEAELERAVDGFMARLEAKVSAAELSELKMLRRIYSSGEFLAVLRRWAEAPVNRQWLAEEDSLPLTQLEREWQALERSLAAVGRATSGE